MGRGPSQVAGVVRSRSVAVMLPTVPGQILSSAVREQKRVTIHERPLGFGGSISPIVLPYM